MRIIGHVGKSQDDEERDRLEEHHSSCPSVVSTYNYIIIVTYYDNVNEKEKQTFSEGKFYLQSPFSKKKNIMSHDVTKMPDKSEFHLKKDQQGRSISP